MQWLLSLFLRYRSPVSLVFALAVSWWMMSLPISKKVGIARTFTTTVFYPIQIVIHQVRKVRNIWVENQKLRNQVARLSVENAGLQEKIVENDRLRKLLAFKEKTSYTLIPAEVIAQNPDRGIYSFVLNVGTNDEVNRNMPVVGIQGVVGKTVGVSSYACHVQLLSDPNCRVSVMTQRSRVAGILESKDGVRFKMKVQEFSDVAISDTIITSGLGGIFPKGLYVGKIRKLKMGKNNIFREAYVELAVDFDYVEEVFVLKKMALWRADTTQADSASPPISQVDDNDRTEE